MCDHGVKNIRNGVRTMIMKRIEGFLKACLWAIPILAVPALLAGPGQTEAASVNRLAGLCRVWGTVKFFHPAMASSGVDWDKALVEAIPMVRAASTPEEFRRAIDHMLAFLKDPSTRAALSEPAAKPDQGTDIGMAAESPWGLSWPEKGIALISVRTPRVFTDPVKTEELLQTVRAAAQAKAVIMDLRWAGGSAGDEATLFYLSNAMSRGLAELLSGEIAMPASRHIMYSGYPTQKGGSSGGYYSAFVYGGSDRFMGMNKEKRSVPLVLIVNNGSNVLSPFLAGLQIAGLAIIIQEGPASAFDAGTSHRLELPDGVEVFIRTSESINPDGTAGFSPDIALPVPEEGQADAALAAAVEVASGLRQISPAERQRLRPLPDFRPDDPYPDKECPAAEYRLMALFRFWTIIDHFFPYKHLLDRPWEETLNEFIPRMESAADAREYALTVAEMVSRITDTHGFINSRELREYFGTAVPPIEVKSIEGETVVTHIYPGQADKVQDIRVGDIVTAVDGEDIAARRQRIGRYISASTPQALAWRIHQNVLSGAKGSIARLRIKDRSGTIGEKKIPRNFEPVRSSRTTPVFSVLPQGYGYIDLARLTIPQVPEAFETIKGTPAVIFDMRGYPKGTAWSITPRLIEEKLAVAKFRRPEPHAVSLDWPSLVSFDQIIEPSPEWKYKGRVVVLINEEAISQAEHTCLFLETAAEACFIGSPTNGANGDVTTMALPGGIFVNFTGHDVRHADGRQLQRVGIQPHIAVKPTIAGIRAGRDEVLERAVAYLQTGQ